MAKKIFKDITWEDLETWAGSKILNRGRSYTSEVEDLRLLKKDKLIAWVYGTEKYVTQVWIEDDGYMDSACTCPYDWGACKHAVAVILRYLELLKNKEKIPTTTMKDPRLKIIEEEMIDWDDDLDDIDDTDDDHETSSATQKIKDFLNKKKKSELVNLILELNEDYDEVFRFIYDRMNLTEGNVKDLCISIRHEINNITDQPAWSNHWSGESSSPDYSQLYQKFKQLLVAGHSDELVELGDHLFSQGQSQIEMSDDDGMTAMEIADCMELAFEALPKSSLSNPDKLLWMIDLFMQDDYCILDNLENHLDNDIYSTDDWRVVANILEKRLKKYPTKNKSQLSHELHKREQLTRWINLAYKYGEQEQNIIPLLEKEVVITNDYITLVDTLIHEQQYDKARQWAYEGYQKTLDILPGIASSLVSRLQKIAVLENDKKLEAAFIAFDFFDRPSLESYKDLKKACNSIRQWPIVSKHLIHHLETGKHPNINKNTSRSQKDTLPPWPLPDCQLSMPKKRWQPEFPNTKVLIEIAIEENQIDEVLKWFNIQKDKSKRIYPVDDNIAEAVQSKYPDISISIWKALAEGHIALVKPAEYRNAAIYLRKMKNLYKRNKRVSEWKEYEAQLRNIHKAKKRFIQVLDSISGRRIIDE